MKISEVIKQLEDFKSQVGDVPVFVFVEVDGVLLVEDKKIEIVSIDTETGPETVVAFTEINDEDDGGSEGPKFQVVK